MASGKTKPKLWRRMSKKYYDEAQGLWIRPGRQLKMFTVGYDGKKQAFGLIESLIKRIDVNAQEIFDKWHPKKVKGEVIVNETK
jgi:hypothetical protein